MPFVKFYDPADDTFRRDLHDLVSRHQGHRLQVLCFSGEENGLVVVCPQCDRGHFTGCLEAAPIGA
jgi:hypothetical protein